MSNYVPLHPPDHTTKPDDTLTKSSLSDVFVIAGAVSTVPP
uniref:Uncharacterized protein n=1 Tax=Anguilla anguilla TaxID=7936 RepID=A0A0E9QAP2_ANGAN